MMIFLQNLKQPKALPAVFDTEQEFIEYTISEALWQSLPTGEIPTTEKWNFTKIVDDDVLNEYGTRDIIVHWEAYLSTCLNFWTNIIKDWQICFK